MSGRTIWQAQDCAWWLRERITELGEEFGPAGPAVANWLECQAKLQNAAGLVKTGYRAIARGAFLIGGAQEAERIVRAAVEIGFLKGFEEGTKTFTATVAAFKEDQARGRDTLNKQSKRDDDTTAQSEEPPRTPPDKSGQTETCPIAPRERREEERTEERTEEEARAQVSALHPDLDLALSELRAVESLVVEPMAVNAAMRSHPNLDAMAAVRMVVAWSLEGGMNQKSASRLIFNAFDKLAVGASKATAAAVRPPLFAGRRGSQPSAQDFLEAGRALAAEEARTA